MGGGPAGGTGDILTRESKGRTAMQPRTQRKEQSRVDLSPRGAHRRGLPLGAECGQELTEGTQPSQGRTQKAGDARPSRAC